MHDGLGMLPIVVLLQEQVRSSGEKGVGRLLRRDDGDDVSVLGIETAEKVKHLACLVDGLADVAECVSELLEPAGVLSMSMSPWMRLWNSASK